MISLAADSFQTYLLINIISNTLFLCIILLKLIKAITMNKIALLFLALSLSLFASEMKIKTGELPAKEMKKQNIEIASLTAASLSKDLPHTIDKYTTLTKVVSEKTTIIWTFEINTGAKSDKTVINEDHTHMKKAVTKGICQSSNKFLTAGINTTYIYVSTKTKVELFRFEISREDCIGI